MLFHYFIPAQHRANNILITVAGNVENIFYNENATSATENLCGYHQGEIGVSAFVPCVFVRRGQFVQVQNNQFQNVLFHLAEVEVFGF